MRKPVKRSQLLNDACGAGIGATSWRAKLGNLGLTCSEELKNLSYGWRFTDPFQGDVTLVI